MVPSEWCGGAKLCIVCRHMCYAEEFGHDPEGSKELPNEGGRNSNLCLNWKGVKGAEAYCNSSGRKDGQQMRRILGTQQQINCEG